MKACWQTMGYIKSSEAATLLAHNVERGQVLLANLPKRRHPSVIVALQTSQDSSSVKELGMRKTCRLDLSAYTCWLCVCTVLALWASFTLGLAALRLSATSCSCGPPQSSRRNLLRFECPVVLRQTIQHKVWFCWKGAKICLPNCSHLALEVPTALIECWLCG